MSGIYLKTYFGIKQKPMNIKKKLEDTEKEEIRGKIKIQSIDLNFIW